MAVSASPISITFFAPNLSAIHPLGIEIIELATDPALSNVPSSMGFAPSDVA